MNDRLIGFYVVLIAVGLAALGAACASSSEQPDVAESAPSDMLAGGSRLITSNRTNLSLCVDGAEGHAVDDAELTAVRRALDDAVTSATDAPTEYAERQVTVGCPPATAIKLVGTDIAEGNKLDEFDWSLGAVFIGQAGAPAEPSPHRVFVYLVEPAVYSQSFESEPYFRNTAERLCLGDECIGVTTAVYLRTTATDEDFRFALSHVLNLVPFVDDPSIDEAFRQNCRLGTPELWCDQLLEGTE